MYDLKFPISTAWEIIFFHYFSKFSILEIFQGLLCGGSCGTAFYHALEVAKTMPEGTTVVTILPDSIRNYMTKHLMDEWMYERELLPPPVLEQNEEWYNRTVSDLPLKKVKILCELLR